MTEFKYPWTLHATEISIAYNLARGTCFDIAIITRLSENGIILLTNLINQHISYE